MLANKGSVVSSTIKVVCVLLGSLFFVAWLCQDSDSIQRLIGSYSTSPGEDVRLPKFQGTRPGAAQDVPREGTVAKLIYDIREAVRVAADGSDVSFSAEDRTAWEEKFPCRSRVELESFYQKREHVRYVPLNKRWQKVLDEYSVLHRVCMSRVGDLKNYFLSKNDSTGCKFLIAEAHYGLGNKVLHMSSLFMYGVLTQRVVLIPTSTSVPPVMCEPFPGSTWSMPDDLHHVVKSDRRNADQLYAAIDRDVSTNESMDIYASQGGGIWGPDIRFWCDTEQTLFKKVTWLTFDGCLHHMPKLFAIAKFRPIMEEIFRTRVVMTQVLRTVMLPADPVWDRIVNVAKVHLAGAEKQVGVQVRFLHGENQYRQDQFKVNEHITQCLWAKGFLPEVCPESNSTTVADGRYSNCSSSSLDPNTPAPVTKVLIASLFLGFHDYLEKIYVHETVDREVVAITQLTHEKTQGSGVEVDSQALVEVITLSFSDVLLITPFSTFGGLAQAYGTLVPYFIEYNTTKTVPCQRGLTTEPCYLGSSPHYECRYDPPDGKNIVDVVPYLQRCMYIDVGPGYSMLMMNANHDDF